MQAFGTLLVLCSLVAALSAADQWKGCPANVRRDNYLVPFENYCFQFNVKEKRDYQEAFEKCVDRGGLLAMPKTQTIQNFLYKELLQFGVKSQVWIGLDDRKLESTFRWADGSALREGLNFWAEGNGPRDGIQASIDDCVVLDSNDGLWHDYRCESLPLIGDRDFYYICQYNKTA